MTHDEPTITPFRGLRYSEEAGDSATLLAPPYDVITPEMQEILYNVSDNNIVRLILGKKNPADSDNDNRYTRAAATLKDWLKRSVLVRDEKPAIYVYAQTFTAVGERKTRFGFIARKRLEEFGGSILPHEKTMAGPKTDRLNLTRACKCNFSQIFGLYADRGKTTDKLLNEVTQKPPTMDVTVYDGINHRLWVVTDDGWIKKLTAVMKDKNVLIADGHHRYETALNYLRENSGKGLSPADDLKYVMMYFTNTESEGLTVLPTHRIIHSLHDFDLESFLKNLRTDFEIEAIPSSNGHRNDMAEKTMISRMANKERNLLGLYTGHGNYLLLTYKSRSEGGVLDKLDVGVLHNRLLEPILGIGAKELAEQSNVSYHVDISTAAARVDSGNSQLAFFLNSTPIEQMRSVAEAGLTMPQKSTYFYPKLISGMVINPLF